MAAGLGFKNFTTGEVLTAADVNGYLNSQTVMVFADAAARTAAITSPQEGMFTYLKDTNSTEYYTGSAWASVSSPGDITEVVAGTGLTGGGTSGSVTLALDYSLVNRLTFNAQTGTTYTLVVGDASNKLVTTSNASAVTVTVPSGVFSAGDQINIQSIGVGLTTIVASGVTITSTGAASASPILRKQYSGATIICTASNVFTVLGDIV
jgi:hypothetical protein